MRELLDISGRYPGKKSFDGLTKEDMMRYLMMFNEDSFINWESGECRFDSEDFQEVLEFVNSFPDFVEYREEEASMPTKVQSGELLFAVADLRAINAFQLYAEIFGEEAAFVGFPTPDGKGGHILLSSDAFAMAAVSGHKEGAWNFIERFLSEEKTRQYYSQENVFYVSLPTLKRTLNAKVEESIAKGKEIQADKYPTRIFDDGWSFQTHLLTWEEVNRMLELVKDARPDFDEECDEVIKIINEEAPAYYSGQKSAEDVAGVIQNRVKLYVSENMVGK